MFALNIDVWFSAEILKKKLELLQDLAKVCADFQRVSFIRFEERRSESQVHLLSKVKSLCKPRISNEIILLFSKRGVKFKFHTNFCHLEITDTAEIVELK